MRLITHHLHALQDVVRRTPDRLALICEAARSRFRFRSMKRRSRDWRESVKGRGKGTADRGYIDDVVDRKKEMIISGGHKIFSTRKSLKFSTASAAIPTR